MEFTVPSTREILASLRPAAANEPSSGIVDAYMYALGKQGIIPMWVGQGHLPTPEFIAKPAIASLKAGETFYTLQRGIQPLRDTLARYHSRLYGKEFEAENFFVCQSGMQSIQMAIQALLSPGDEVLLPSPAWPNYAMPFRMAGINPIEFSFDFRDGYWHLDLDRMFAAVTPKTRALLMNTPSNPLGRVLKREEIIAVRDFARARGLWIIADEVYARFYYGDDESGRDTAPSFLEHCDIEERLFSCNTFSKNWAMTGWRMGWCVAPRAMGQVIENMVQVNTSGAVTFLQPACVSALEDGEDFLALQRRQAREGRDIICDALRDRTGVEFAVPEGAFYLFFKVEGGGRDLYKRLIDETGVGCAPGAAFGPGGEDWLRLCFARAPEQVADAAERLVNWLKKRR